MQIGNVLAEAYFALEPLTVDGDDEGMADTGRAARQAQEVLAVLVNAFRGVDAGVELLEKWATEASRRLGPVGRLERRTVKGTADKRHVDAVIQALVGTPIPTSDSDRDALARQIFERLAKPEQVAFAAALRRRWRSKHVWITPVVIGPLDGVDLSTPATPEEEAEWLELQAPLADALGRDAGPFVVSAADVTELERCIGEKLRRTGTLTEGEAEALVQRALSVGGIERPENLVRGGKAPEIKRELKPDPQ